MTFGEGGTAMAMAALALLATIVAAKAYTPEYAFHAYLFAAAGLAVGLSAAFGASKLITSFLFGMEPNDPWTLTAAVAILLASAILAG